MITEKGTLPVGVEFAGKVHKDFEIRPQKVADNVNAMENPKAGNDAYFGVLVWAARIERLGDIPKRDITPDLIMEMTEVDFKTLLEASEALNKRLREFRWGEESNTQEDTGHAEAGVPSP